MVKETTDKTQTGKQKIRSKRVQAFVQVLMVIGIAVALNVIATYYFKRVDLTGDKRYTLSTTTKTILKNLKDQIYIKVYLDGKDLPSGFRALSENTREMLDEFRVIGGDKIQYEFIDPESLDKEVKENLYKQLSAKGLPPMEVDVKGEEEETKKTIIPGAIITYNNVDFVVELLDQERGDISPDETLHNSTIELEYKLMNGIHKLMQTDQPKIAFIEGHGELKNPDIEDIAQSLSQYYRVDFVNLPDYKVGRLDPYDAIIVAKPDSFFTELEKYKIDQYIMGGGKALFLISNLKVDRDSLAKKSVTFSTAYNTNLIEDFLFKYGVRINYDIVQDLNCHLIPLVSPYGGTMQRNLLRWPYYPLALPTSNHPIVNNLGAVWFQFANTMDTIHSRQNPDVKKTILLQTSQYSRVMLNPVRVDLNLVSMLKKEAPLFQQGPKTLAVLLEGTFTSTFNDHRPTAETLATGEYGVFKDKSKPTKMIVVSDGDVIQNQVIQSTGLPLPLGYDRYSNHTFSNKTFIMNCIDYMVDQSGLIALRSKDIPYRPLDKGRVKVERLYWQMFNMALPIAVIVFFGLIFNYIRRRRFAA